MAPARSKRTRSVVADRFDPEMALEVPLWFQRDGELPIEDVTLRRPNAFDQVAEEVAAVRNDVGMFETTGEFATSDGPWQLEVVGVMRPAARLGKAPFDPSGSRMRS